MNITIKYGLDSIVKSYPAAPNAGQVLSDINIRAVLGFGDNVRALVNGVEQPSDSILPDGGTLVVETRANTKASPDITVTVQYGLDRVTRTLPGPVTVEDVLDDENIKAVLGFGDNVRCLIDGVEQPLDAGLFHQATLVIETRANTKAN